MKRLSRNNNIRLGIILVATGVIAILHSVLSITHHLSPPWDLIVGIVLVVAAIPFLVVAVRYESATGGPTQPQR